MFSQCVGKLNIDNEEINLDLSKISDRDYLLDYSEYTVGFWRSIVLMNHNGKASDGEVLEYDEPSIYTKHINKLPYIKKIIESNFHSEKIKLIRIVTIKKNGIILPHIDYLTFKKVRARYNIPLISNKMAISIEDNDAYSMRPGEIWDLDATTIHSAGSFSDQDRVSLIIDFDCENECNVIKNNDIFNYKKNEKSVMRKSIDVFDLERVINLSVIINEYNYRDILSIVAKIPFFYNIPIISVFDIMEDICEKSNKNNLINSIKKTRRMFLKERNEDIVSGIY